MAHTHINCLLHVVFSTKNRAPLIAPTWRPRLHGFLSSIAADRKFPTVIVGGVEDHVHLLISLPADRPICDCARLLKGTSSKWVNDQFFPDRSFAWQVPTLYDTLSLSNLGQQMLTVGHHGPLEAGTRTSVLIQRRAEVLQL